MSLMGTLAKVAIGYATARGVDKMTSGGGLGDLLGQGQQDATDAQASNPMADLMKQMMGGGAETSGASNPMADMMNKMTGSDAGASNPMADMMKQMMGGAASAGGGAMDLQGMLGSLMGGAADNGDKGGLLSSLGGGQTGANAGLAGILSALGGAAAVGGKGVGDMLDGFGKAAPAAPETEATAGLLLRAMIQAAKCDGDIDDAERAKILETVGEDADAEDIAFIQAQLAAPLDVEGLAADTPEAQKFQVYSMSIMAIRVDTPAEKAYMSALADALGIDAQTAQMLNMQMGVAG